MDATTFKKDTYLSQQIQDYEVQLQQEAPKY